MTAALVISSPAGGGSLIVQGTGLQGTAGGPPFGTGCTRRDVDAMSWGGICFASAPYASAGGYSVNVAITSTYGAGFGAYINCYSAGNFAAGELVDAGVVGGADGQNATIVGFGGYARGRYSHVHGSYCYTVQGAQGSFVCGYKAASSRPGELAHGGGSDYIVPLRSCSLEVLATAASTKMLDILGGTFTLPANSLHSIRVRITASTAGRTKVACEVHELFVKVTAAATVVTDDTIAGAGSLAGQGWSVTISGQASGELRLLCNPGADTVRFFAALEMSEVTGV